MHPRNGNLRFTIVAAICIVLAGAGIGWGAAGGSLILGQSNSSGTAPTSVTASPTTVAAAFQVTATGTAGGPAIKGIAQNGGAGVVGSTANVGKFGMIAQNTAASHGAGGALQALGGYDNGVVATSRYDAINATSSGASNSGLFANNTGGGYGVFVTSTGDAIHALSTSTSKSAVYGVNNSGGFGVYAGANSANSAGVYAANIAGDGVQALSADANHSGLYARNTGGGYGVYALSDSDGVHSISNGVERSALYGENNSVSFGGFGGYGVYGASYAGYGVYGTGQYNNGVRGTSDNSYGVYGEGDTAGGVYGTSMNASGVTGTSNSGHGVSGSSNGSSAVYASGYIGVEASGAGGDGVRGIANTGTHSGLYGENTSGGWGVYSNGKGYIGGDLQVTGNIHLDGTCYCSVSSDRALKTHIASADTDAILDAVAKMPVSTWSYKKEANVTHIGPMSQDFKAAFGLGDSDRKIAMVDEGGVALAAIKSLADHDRRLATEIAALKNRLGARPSASLMPLGIGLLLLVLGFAAGRVVHRRRALAI